jgi:DNA mismatch repair protein MutL
MSRIRVLADDVVNRIAAGEVVERPASVVKELVENAVDAGAARIEVDLVAGGRSMVRVADDGGGMGEHDALLAIERHATSKLSSAEDLDTITTLGFRGEALPSIAAVSRFRLTSCADPEAGGVELRVDGGAVLGVEPCVRGRGTTVEVADLFFNTPARRKFLHAPETELRHAQEAVVAMSLARLDVAFAVRHGGRTLVDAPPTTDLDQRIRDAFKIKSAGSCHRFDHEMGAMRAHGLIAPGRGSGRAKLTVLVNGRWVKDRLLVGAVYRVLRSAGSGFGGARIVLLLETPPESVDVNVHPAKAEVRFARSGAVFALVERAIRDGVAASHGTVDVRSVEHPDRFDALSRVSEPDLRSSAQQRPPLFPHPVYESTSAGSLDPPIATAAPKLAQPSSQQGGARPGTADTPFGRLIGQYRESFILLEDRHGLVIVDQHVAHERVLYDRILRQLGGETAPSQRLLTPILAELGEALVGALPRVEGLLDKVGIEADVFGPDTVRIAALPPDLEPEAAEELVRDLLERATELDGVPERVAESLVEELAAALSCRAAIKINHRLVEQAQRGLLADLAAADDPYRCPHGRPIILRLSQEEMERRLGRR